MKDLQKLFSECLSDLSAIGIMPGNITEVKANTRAKKRWGQARRDPVAGSYSISIAQRLLEDSLPDWPVKNTLMHEILHCVDGCWSHKGKWKMLAEKCNRELGTRIVRCSDYSDVVPRTNDVVPSRQYAVQCTGCGKTVYRVTRSKVIMHPERYRCGSCGGRLKRVK